MRYLSVCSGIEAATVAWRTLGWKPVAFSEIEPFPSAVLKHHYPDVPNLGDMTKIDGRAFRGKVDVLVGGTPCQAFSVAGLRKGLEDARGNLTVVFAKICNEIQPDWIVWENVPGVLSDKTNAFGCLLAALSGEVDPFIPPGGRWTDAGHVAGPERVIAWRVLDAQYFGLAQRRRRVFLVACPRGGADPGEILLNEPGMPRHNPPCREAGEGFTHDVAGSLGGGSGSRGWCNDLDRSGAFIPQVFGGANPNALDVATTLNAKGGVGRLDFESESLIDNKANPQETQEYALGGEVCQTVTAKFYKGYGGPAGSLSECGNLIDNKAYYNAAGMSKYIRNDSATCLRANQAKQSDSDLIDYKANNSISFHSRQDPISENECPLPLEAKGGQAICVPIQNATRGKSQNGIGIGDENEPMYTLDRASQHAVLIGGIDNENNAFGNTEPCGPLMKNSPTGGGRPLPAVCFQQNTRDEVRKVGGDGQITGALSAQAGMKQQNYIAQGFQTSQSGVRLTDSHATLDANNGSRRHNGIIAIQEVGKRTGKSTSDPRAGIGIGQEGDLMFTLQAGAQHGVAAAMQVRRLTPKECERLQGFPDNYTRIPWRNKPAEECPDGPRYRALGNSMAVPCMRWIGRRIELCSRKS